MTCHALRPYLEAFVDNELSPERTLDVQRHIESCQPCRGEVELSRTLAAVTRSAVADAPVCPDFQARLGRCLADERRRQERAGAAAPLSWRTITPIAVAAGLALLFGAAQRGETMQGPAVVASSENQLMDLLLAHHAAPLAPAVTAIDSLAGMEPELGFPVHAPNLEQFGGHFLGANLVNVNRAHAASLHYRLKGGRRVTFYVYDPEQLPLRAAVHTLHPRVVNNQAVFVGQRRGYSIATCERQGVGYAVAAEMSDSESAELVVTLHR